VGAVAGLHPATAPTICSLSAYVAVALVALLALRASLLYLSKQNIPEGM